MWHEVRPLWPALFLLPGLGALFIALTGGPLLAPLTAWCRDWWWTLLACGSLPWLAVLLLHRLRRLRRSL